MPFTDVPHESARTARRRRLISLLVILGLVPVPAAAQSCELYPLALSAQVLQGVAPGGAVPDLLNGTQAGNFGWLTWAGSPSTPTLVASLTPPGNSATYVNPDNPLDHQINLGDWIQGKPGVSNGRKVRDALGVLMNADITVPVWDQARGHGASAAYRVAAFARVRLLDYELPRQNRISARFLGYVSCDAANQPPVAHAQSLATDEDTPLEMTLTGRDPEGACLSFTNLTQAAYGTLSGTPPRLVYTPKPDYHGLDSFRFKVSDGHLESDDAVVTLTVRPVNDAPVGDPLNVQLEEDTATTLALIGSDVEGNSLTFTVLTPPSHGTLHPQPSTPGIFTYTPGPDYFGPDRFTFSVNDGSLDSAPAAVALDVTPVNDPPIVSVCGPQSVTLPAVASLAGSASDDDTPEGAQLSGRWEKVSGPGSVSFIAAGSLTTTAAFDAPGSYVLRFVVTDSLLSASADTTVTVLPPLVVNQPPVVEAGPDRLALWPGDAAAAQGNGVAERRRIARDHRGTDFWVAFPENVIYTTPFGNISDLPDFRLAITAEQATTGTVSLAALGFTTNFAAGAGQTALVNLPPWSEVRGGFANTRSQGVHITTRDEVTVLGLSLLSLSTDSFLALPTDALGTNYFVLTYGNDAYDPGAQSAFPGSQFLVVAVEDDTLVQITPSLDTVEPSAASYGWTEGPWRTNFAGATYSMALHRGDAYALVQSRDYADLTGSHITADKPIAVFGAHKCFRVPYGCPACNHAVEQLPPVHAWGRRFLTVPFASRDGGDTLRCLAAQPNTQVCFNGVPVATLGPGQFYECIRSNATEIVANQPLLVAQYAHGCLYDSSACENDPFMLLVPAVGQFLEDYVLNVPDFIQPPTPYLSHYLNLVVPLDALESLMADGLPIPLTGFQPIGTSGFAAAQFDVLPGNHRVRAAHPFGVTVYGFERADGHGHPGGLLLSATDSVRTLTLDPTSLTQPAGGDVALVATVQDEAGQTLPGVRVEFLVTGANPATLHAFTDDAGQAYLSYPALNPGTDSITASAGQASDTATRSLTTECSLDLAGSVSDDGQPAGTDPVVNWSAVNGPGTVLFSDPTNLLTRARFSAPGTYRLGLTASDSELSSSDDLTVIVRTNQAPVVSAGPDRTHVLPDPLPLEGWVSDDGWPEGARSQVTWTAVAGPGRVQFSDRGATNAQATFPGPGRYQLRLTAWDSLASASAELTVTALERPHVEWLSPTNGSLFTEGDPITLQARARDSDGRVIRVEFLANNRKVAEGLGPLADGSWAARWTNDVPGQVALVARAIDNDDLINTTDPVTIQVNARPVIEFLSPTNGSVLGRPPNSVEPGPSVDLAIEAHDPDGTVTNVQYYLLPYWYFIGPDVMAPPFTATLRNLWAGDYTVLAFACDDRGAPSAAPAEVHFTVGYQPDVAILSPSPGSIVPVAQPVDIVVAASDLDGAVAAVEVWDGESRLGDAEWRPETGDWRFVAPGFTRGQHVLTARARDDLGLAAASPPVAVVASRPPMVVLNAPAEGSTFDFGQSLGLLAEAGDPDGFVQQVEFRANHELLSEVSTAPFAGSWQAPPAGIWDLTAIAVNDLGVSATSAVARVAVRAVPSAPPMVRFLTPTNRSVLTRIEPLLLHVAVTDPDGYVAGVEFFDGTNSLGEVRAPIRIAEPPAEFSLIWTQATLGPHDLCAIATDNSGTLAAAPPVSIELRNVPPEITLWCPRPGTDFGLFLGRDLPVDVWATDPDGSVTRVDLFLDGAPAGEATDTGWGSFTATIGGLTEGRHTFTAVATDNDGEQSATLEASFRVGTYRGAPHVSLAATNDSRSITAPTAIRGTATNVFPYGYALYHRLRTPDDRAPWVEFHRGYDEVIDGDLGVFDPTLLPNGVYEVQVMAWDYNNPEFLAQDTVPVVVEGRMKLGHFTVSFNDLTIPVAGLPIEIIRTYDTAGVADAGSPGDFGVGWTLGLKSIRLQKNRPLGKDWQARKTGGDWPTYSLHPGRPRQITLTFPDGRIARFAFEPNPMVQPLFPIEYPQWRFTPLPGTYGTLVPASYDEPDGSFLATVGSWPVVEGTNTVDLFDLNHLSSLPSNATTEDLYRHPTLFRYTTPEGHTYLIDENEGLRSLKDPNGNTLLISTGALTWSNVVTGASLAVTFQRDDLGRITTITDALGYALRYVYDDQGDLAAFIDRDGHTNSFSYDARHRLLTLTNANGVQATRNEYDNAGRLVRTFDARAHAIEYTHLPDTRQEVITDRLGNTTVHECDDRGNVVRTTDPLGGVSLYTYDDRDQLLSKVNAADCHCGATYTYDSAGNRLTETDPLGNTTSYTYNAQRKILTFTVPDDQTTTNTYDAAGNLTSTRDPLGNVTTFTHNAQGRVTSMIDPRGFTNLYQYDARGYLTNSIDALGHVTEYEVDANGRVLAQTTLWNVEFGVRNAEQTEMKSVLGVRNAELATRKDSPITNTVRLVLRYEYWPSGTPLRTFYYDGTSADFTYNPDGKLLASTDAQGCTTTRTYDELGRLIALTHCDGCGEQFAYDAAGNRVSYTDTRGFQTRYAYDALGRLTNTVFADGSSLRATYSLDGRLLSETAKNGAVTSYTYDGAGNRLAVSNSAGVTRYTYNARGAATSMTDPLGRTTTYDHDALNRVIQITYPDGSTRSSTWEGRLVTSETDQNGAATFYAYDGLGQLIAVTNAAGAVLRFAYDTQGNKVEEADANNQVTRHEYDSMRRRVRTLHPDGATETFAYDTSGHLVSQIDPAGKTTAYTYDARGNLLSVTDPLNGTTRYTYDCSNNRLTETNPANETTTYTYDALNRQTRITHPDGTSETTTYDLAGRVVASRDPAGQETRFTYDLRDNLLSITDPLGRTTSYSYDAANNRVSETDPAGETTRFTHDRLNRPTGTRHPDSRTEQIAYDPAGRIVSRTAPGGRTTQFVYDAVGRLLSQTDPAGRTTSFTYDPAGNPLTRTEPGGRTSAFAYDERGRRTQTTLPDGSILRTAYDSRGLPVTRTDPLGQTTELAYDDGRRMTSIRKAPGIEEQMGYDLAGRLVSRTDGLNRTTRFAYDGRGRLTAITYADGTTRSVQYSPQGWPLQETDPAGNTTRYEYDAAGHLLTITRPLNTVTRHEYSPLGQRVATTDPLGRLTKFAYDLGGRLTTLTYPDNSTRSYDYDAGGRLVSETDPKGNVTRYTVDALDRVTQVTDALGGVARFNYDPDGRLASVTDPLSHSTSFSYDALGRRTGTIFTDGATETRAYDARGRLVSRTGPAGQTHTYGYDPLDRLVSVTDPAGGITRYAYDAAGQLIAQTDAAGRVTTYTYDLLGRRMSRTLPGGEAESCRYDAVGNRIERTDFNGVTTTFTFDALNRLTAQSAFRIPNSAIEFAYNALGQRTSMTDPAGATIYDYDLRNRLITKTRTWNVAQASSLSLESGVGQPSSLSVTLAYAYDANGNLTGIASSNPNSTAVTYEYDALNRLTAVNDAHLGRTAYTHDAAGNLQACVHPNGIGTVYEFDALNRLTNVSTLNAQLSTLASYGYTLGPAGHRLTATETVIPDPLNPQPSTIERAYTYDPLYRLTGETTTVGQASSLSASLTYAYDPIGNRLARGSDLPALDSTSYAYDTNDRLTTDTFDANGNTLVGRVSPSAPSVMDTYDSENHLIQRLTTLNSQPTTLNFSYDGDGHRVSKTVVTTDGIATATNTTYYVVDDRNLTGYAQVLEELGTRNSELGIVAEVSRVLTWGHSLLAQDRFTGTAWTASFYGHDALGSVRSLTDLEGRVTDTYDYDAFGNLIAQGVRNPDTGALEPVSQFNVQRSTFNVHRLNGEEFDPDLGLYYLRARYANPDTGRFWTADTFEGFADDPPSLHRYAFNHNDPVNRHDPTGHFSMAEMSMVSGLTPMVRGLGMDLFTGAMGYAYGLSGGSGLKAESRAEAYLIDSLAQGAGWKLGKAEFWAAAKGAPFLLAWNPNITSTPKPCYYECLTFDDDVPIYGPAAQHPMFDFDEDPFHTWLNTDHADWWFRDSNFPPPRSTDSFLENVYGNAHADAQRYSAGFSESAAHGLESLIRFGSSAVSDPRGTGAKVIEQVAAGLQELPEQVVSVVNDPMPVVERMWQTLQTPEGVGEAVFDTEALLASFAIKLPLPKGFKPPLRLPARALAPARSLVGPTEAVCRKPLGNALDWSAHVGARTQARLRNALSGARDRLANRAVSETAVEGRQALQRSAIMGAEQSEFNFVGSLGPAPKPIYPPDNGVLGSPGLASLLPGTRIDRFGSDLGRFVSPEGTPFIQRSLPSSSADAPYSVFEVIKPVEVQAGQVAPWFGMRGGGLQYQLPKTVDELISEGYLRPVLRLDP